jgi:hypothetical protein
METKKLILSLKSKKDLNIFQNGLIDDYIRQYRLIEKMEKKKFKTEDDLIELEIENNYLHELYEQLCSADIL